MPKTADRVQETSTSTGTGNFSLAGASSGFQGFNAAFGTNVRFWYSIVGGTEWETGYGYLTDTTTLVREQVSESSNGGALVNFTSGSKQVFCTQPAKSVNLSTKGRAFASTRGLDMM